MEKAEFERITQEINRHPLTDFYSLTPSKDGFYCCPICGSGHGHNGHYTGALKLYPRSNRVRCYADDNCFTKQGEDTLGALCRIWSKNPLEVMQELGYVKDTPIRSTKRDRTPTATATKPTAAPKKPTPPPTEDYTERYREWHDLLIQAPEALAYLEGRGITRSTIDELNLGYCSNLGYGAKHSYSAPRIIIPYSKHYYKARRIDGNDGTAKYIPSGGGEFIYNTAAFSDTDTDGTDRHLFPIYVVEGELNAVAILQGGYKRVVALGSKDNREAFIEQATQKNPGAVYILALDNDPENPTDPDKGRRGQKAQAKLAQLMDAAGLDYISANTGELYGEYTDAADAALHDPDGKGFWTRFNGYVEHGYYKRQHRDQAAELEAYYRSGPGMVDTFLQAVKGERYKPTPTGIDAIDRAIGGGLYRQTVVVLGAAPGMGKTSLAAQIGESIAKSGAADVLYINLEMSREQLLARSLARIAYLKGHKTISTSEILQGYSWTIDTEEAVYEAADEYKATIAQHLLYNPGEDTTDLDAIMQKIQDEKKRLGHAPLVILDYLQLLTGESQGRAEDSVATIKRTMQRMKQYAIKEDTTVIIITANNRDSMRTGDSDINSGRDTSNIEYGADLHLGLVFTAAATGEKDIKAIRKIRSEYLKNKKDPAAATEYEAYCTSYTLKVNKNRHGEEGREAMLHFNGACAMFTPIDTVHKDPGR